MNIITMGTLISKNLPLGWRFTAYTLAGCSGGLSGIIMAWAHEICTRNNEERAFVIGSMNEMAYVLQAWLPLLVWKQTDAPHYQKGFATVTVLAVLMIATAVGTKVLHLRELKRLGAPPKLEL
jgi:ACS family pantothenate transporter-like MFS transporter